MSTVNEPNLNANSAPAPIDATPSEPLKDLERDGLLQRLLDKAFQHPNPDARRVRDQIAKSLDTIRAFVQKPTTYMNISPTPKLTQAGIQAHIVNCKYHIDQTDPVLRHCLAVRWEISDPEDALRTTAMGEYQQNPEAYDAVLGDFLPPDFQAEGSARAARQRFDTGGHRTAEDDWPVYCERLQRRRSLPLLGVSTGLSGLDSALNGLRGLTFLGGGTGVGKTSLALFMAIQALGKHPDLGVLFYSLDMSKNVLYDRLFCQEAGIQDGALMHEPEGDAYQRLAQAESRLRAEVLPRLRVMERLEVGKEKSTFKVITEDIYQLCGTDDVAKVLIVVDYFQLLPVPREASTALDADFHRVHVLQRVQEWSRTNGLPAGYPILAISEVRKGESGRAEINVGDLMGSARLGYSADSILLLEATKEVEGPVVPVQLKVAKGRDGAERARIDLLFEHAIYRFREAPKSRSRHQGGNVGGKAAPGQKADPGKVDPLAGLEGNP